MLQGLLVIARELQDLKGEGQVLRSLRLAYVAAGDLTGAIEYQQRRCSLARNCW